MAFMQSHSTLPRAMPLEPRRNLCPDCWQHWARSVAGCPRRRSAPLQNDLLVHLRQAAEECQAGAGQSDARAPQLRLKHVRRWLLAYIRKHNGAQLPQMEAEPGRRAPCADLADAQRLLVWAARALCSERTAFCHLPLKKVRGARGS